jgi:hypothetical protein
VSPRDEPAPARPLPASPGADPAPTDWRRLWVVHWPAPAGTDPLAPGIPGANRAGIVLGTCQRMLAFGLQARPTQLGRDAQGEIRTGMPAYRFLLEVASGLRSAVPGETNVFGQLQRAWERGAAALPAAITAELAPLVDTLLADTRAIRETHLQGIGGRSYGSLARRLLRPHRQARILVIGAGDLARSVLPFFRNARLGGWNHRPAAALPGLERWFPPEEADAAAAWAEHLIFTTPADADHDGAWGRRLPSGNVASLLHFGRRRSDTFAWPSAINAFDLDHVFALAAEQENVRSLQLARARAACAATAVARIAGPQRALRPKA